MTRDEVCVCIQVATAGISRGSDLGGVGRVLLNAFGCRALAGRRVEGGDSLSSVVFVFAPGCLLVVFVLFVCCRLRA